MAFKLNDRVKESSSTTGTGTFSLAGASRRRQGGRSIWRALFCPRGSAGEGNESFWQIWPRGNLMLFHRILCRVPPTNGPMLRY